MSETENKAKPRKPITRKLVIAAFVFGIAVCGVSVALWVFGRRPKVTGPHPPRWLCAANLSWLGKAMEIYANDFDGEYPTADKWCDLLLVGDYVTLKTFLCPRSGAIKAESSFALNVNVVGRKRSEVPPNVVLLFETNFGIDPLGRQGWLKERQFYKFFPRDPETRVYKLRWNQSGGPEILTTEYHDGEGCMVLFNDGSVDFVRTKELSKLKWK